MKHRLWVLFGSLLFVLAGPRVQAQQQSYQGNVKDTDGAPLSGVSIAIKGTSTGTVTDGNGSFTIQAKRGDYLVFSYVGYEGQEILLGESRTVDVVLSPQVNLLEEMVVVGYGQVRKGDLTSAISSVKAADLVKTSVTSLDQGLQGRAAGMVVTNTSGQPGAATSIRIRGTSSIMGTNEPLYVIDGIPVIGEGSTSTGMFHSPALNSLTSINPGDVESIEILKDASATAIYGARGANGVILITTKRGSSGRVKTSFNAYYGLQQVANTMNMLNAEQLAMLGNEAADNANIDRKLIFADLNNLRKRSTDWQSEIFRIAPIQNYELSFSGGNDAAAYFLSANYMGQDGIIIGSDFNKANVRLNLDQRIGSRLKVGTSLNVSHSSSNGVVTNSEGAFASSITSWALEMNPALPVRQADGSYVYENNTSNPAVGNPVQDANEFKQLNKTARALGNFYADLTLTEGLNFKSSVGIDYYQVKEQSFSSKDIKRGESNGGSASVGTVDGYTWLWENTLNYNRRFGTQHQLNAVAGMTVQAFEGQNLAVANSEFNDGRLGYYAIQAGARRQITNSGYSGWQMLSYLARANYSYANRYLVTLTGRVDGSSKFGANNRYGFFPSAAVAWRASEEPFLQDWESLSDLKIRVGYGVVGNEGIPPYSSQGLLLNMEAYIGDSEIIKGQAPYTLNNKELKWETTAQFDVGLDVGLFNNRYSLTADFYIKKTSDLLLNVPVAFHTGYDLAMQNVGDMENRGFEVALNAVPVDGNRFKWDANLTFGFNRNKVTNLVGTEEGLIGASIMGISNWTRVKEGTPIGTMYGYKTDGIAQLNENLGEIPYFPGRSILYGDRKYVDKNGDGGLNEADLFVLGNANPDFTYGWNNTFSFNLGERAGNIHLSLFLQGVYGNEIANFNKFALESFDGTRNNTTTALERWTPDNPSNRYPRANATPMAAVMSDHQLEDGSYLRVKDVTLAYDLPNTWLRNIRSSALQIAVGAKNIYTFTNYSGFDPEVSRFGADNLSMGADYGTYPIPKLYTISLKANF